MSKDRLPPQTKFIVGNEACERLSYYGVMAILTLYATNLFGGGEQGGIAAKKLVHGWIMLTYLLPLLGAWIADRYWGRFRTILWISFAYCAGHALMSATEGTKWGLYAGLILLAIGSGGIKPCVSAFVGDQFGAGQEKQLTKAYGLFYWSINFGSFFSFAVIPYVREKTGSYAVGFLIPGIFMLLATAVFYAGRRHYVMKPPTTTLPPVDPQTRATDRTMLWRIALVFLPVTVFWSLFHQQHTTWVQQGQQMMPMKIGNYALTGETMQSSNPIFVMLFIPAFLAWVYPAFARWGIAPTLLRRMGSGMVFAAAAFFISAMLQKRIEGGEQLSVLWQLLPYAVMTAGEVLISATGLEFAFSVAPMRLKSTIMSFWLLSVAIGNMLAGKVTEFNSTKNAAGETVRRISVSNEMLAYVALMLVVTAVFAAIASRFRETAPPSATPPQP
jgi:POT family proton-dependent oligopeptide transporter